MRALSFWKERAPGERRAIAAAAAMAVGLLFIAFAWLPLERARDRMLAELPRLRASIAVLEGQALEVKRLRALPATARAATASLAGLAGASPLAGAQVSALDERRVRVVATDTAFGALLDWLAAVQASHGLRVESARLDALPAAGRVRAELILSRS